MSSRASARVQILLATCAAISVFLVAPASAGAATVLNGDFETGNLSGWQVLNNPSGAGQTGSWFAYSGTSSPLSLSTVPPPPAGNYAAITDQEFVGTHILYQDVALEPNWTHELSMTVYYVSKSPLVTPMPDTLSSGGGEGGPPPNQQYRIDVMKPTASPESVNPEDILATVFATSTGSPQQLVPTQYTVNLTPFAGQTVRLRLAEVDNEGAPPRRGRLGRHPEHAAFERLQHRQAGAEREEGHRETAGDRSRPRHADDRRGEEDEGEDQGEDAADPRHRQPSRHADQIRPQNPEGEGQAEIEGGGDVRSHRRPRGHPDAETRSQAGAEEIAASG
ncbi:MAG: hypothetical protein ACTHO8_12675 [Solirubrobacterales bacterium]